jgi:hypothetical protein
MMPPQSNTLTLHPAIADDGLNTVIALGRQLLDQLNELLTISAPLLNTLVALGRTLRNPTGGMAPIRRSPKSAALPVPYQESLLLTGTSPSSGHRLGAPPQSRRNNTSARPATGHEIPEVEPAAIPMRRPLDTAPGIHGGQMWTGEASWNAPLEAVQISPTSEVGLSVTQAASSDHPIINERATSEHETEPASPVQFSDHMSLGRHKPSVSGVDVTRLEPRWSSLVYSSETTPIDDEANQEDANEEEINQTRPNITGSPSKYQNFHVKKDQMTKLRRSAPRQDPNSVHGTLYLDGSSLGHWVIDHLANEATRPNTGTTGFDPRITATYPGAPIGG